MELFLSRQANGLYMLTKFKPLIELIEGTETVDLYIVAGEPIGVRNICNAILKVVGLENELKRLESIKIELIGKT